MNIDQEFRSLIPALTNEEYKQLEENIIKEGCRDALVIWNDILIDGHNRYEICTKNNIPFNTVVRKFENREEVIEWIIKNQLGRRNMSDYSKGILTLKFEDVIKIKAKEKQYKGTNQYSLRPNSPQPIKPIKVIDELAKIAGIGSNNMKRIKVIEREASPEQKQELVKKTKTINKVFHELGHGSSKKKVIEPIKEVIEPIEETIEEETKICTVCALRKPISDFRKGHKICKDCSNYISNSKTPNIKKILRSQSSHVINGVDIIYEDMKNHEPSEEGSNKVIYDESITQLENIVNNFKIAINKFLYMQSIFKGNSHSKDLLENTVNDLKTIINLMED